jgi:hypothetical protein
MSIETLVQEGGGERIEMEAAELQLLVFGLFMLWDALGKAYTSEREVEMTVVKDFARKHGYEVKGVWEEVMHLKRTVAAGDWALYLQGVPGEKHSFASTTLFEPLNKEVVLGAVRKVLENRPFPEAQEGD